MIPGREVPDDELQSPSLVGLDKPGDCPYLQCDRRPWVRVGSSILHSTPRSNLRTNRVCTTVFRMYLPILNWKVIREPPPQHTLKVFDGQMRPSAALAFVDGDSGSWDLESAD